jgi:SAM-dependent methyltransferase
MFIIISLIFASLIFFMFLAIVMGAPMVPSRSNVAKRMIELLRLKPGDTFYDLGSGDGRLILHARKYGARAYGVEMNPYIWFLSYLRVLISGSLSQVHISVGNYWRANLKDADAVAIYALPQVMNKLSVKLKRELKKGSRVVSNSFQIPGLRLVKRENIDNYRIYLYRV